MEKSWHSFLFPCTNKKEFYDKAFNLKHDVLKPLVLQQQKDACKSSQ